MIVLLGPAGSGKGTQGELLVENNGYTSLSMGQLLRDEDTPEIRAMQAAGQLGSIELINEVLGKALAKITDYNKVILDGYPRSIEQAEWLIDSVYEKYLDAIIVIDVPREELIKRMELRGRADDNKEAIEERLRIYRDETEPLIDYMLEKNIKVKRIDGMGSEQQIHKRIVEALKECNIE